VDGKAPPVLFGAGETVGEVQFMDGEPAGGTLTALERADLIVIRSAKLADALAGHPEAGYELYRAIARSLAARLRRAVAMLAFAREREARS
jgi:CRP-like cAMP-binding protein